jgi:hypothetical protein
MILSAHRSARKVLLRHGYQRSGWCLERAVAGGDLVPGQKPRAEPWLMGSVESENPAETLAFGRAVQHMLYLYARGF